MNFSNIFRQNFWRAQIHPVAVIGLLIFLFSGAPFRDGPIFFLVLGLVAIFNALIYAYVLKHEVLKLKTTLDQKDQNLQIEILYSVMRRANMAYRGILIILYVIVLVLVSEIDAAGANIDNFFEDYATLSFFILPVSLVVVVGLMMADRNKKRILRNELNLT